MYGVLEDVVGADLTLDVVVVEKLTERVDTKSHDLINMVAKRWN